MKSNNTQQRQIDIDRIVETVTSWTGITTGSGRFGSTSFQLAGSEIGHLHSRLADIDYPNALREQLIASGRTAEHHAVPKHPTATTLRLDSADDVDHAIWLFRLSYIVHVAILQKTGETNTELREIKSHKEIADLTSDTAIRSAFEAAIVDSDTIRN